MDETLATLIEQAKADIAELTRGLKAGEITVGTWQGEIADTLATYHTAAYLLAAGVDDINTATRKALEATVSGQIERLDAFATTITSADEWSDGFDTRAGMYGDALKGSWWRGATDGTDLPAMPGDGSSACLTNCGCEWSNKDDGWYWVRGKDDSCADCIQREQDWAPYTGGA